MSSEKLDEAIAKNRERFHGEFLKLDTPNLDISSGNIRDRIRDGQTVRYYLPDSVIAYMEEHQLYRQRDEEQSEKAFVSPCSDLPGMGLNG